MKTNNQFINRLRLTLMGLAFCFLAFPEIASAQAIYKAVPSKDMICVNGTSNVHDWEMRSDAAESQGTFKFSDDGKLTGITGFVFSVPAKSLKSDHKSMDNRTYKLLKADEHKNIKYNLTATGITTVSATKFLVKTNGTLTIAGVTKPTVLEVTVTVHSDKSITCSGSEKLKLTDFNMQPPSYLAGAMKVGNELGIAFNLNYKK